METQQGEVCVLFVIFVLLTSVELMSLFSPNERHFIQGQQDNTLKVYLTFQQIQFFFSFLFKSTTQAIQKAWNQISIDC